jgi:hypothetical protein
VPHDHSSCHRHVEPLRTDADVGVLGEHDLVEIHLSSGIRLPGGEVADVGSDLTAVRMVRCGGFVRGGGGGSGGGGGGGAVSGGGGGGGGAVYASVLLIAIRRRRRRQLQPVGEPADGFELHCHFLHCR